MKMQYIPLIFQGTGGHALRSMWTGNGIGMITLLPKQKENQPLSNFVFWSFPL